MRHFLLAWCFFFILPEQLSAIEPLYPLVSDSVLLDEITCYGDQKKYQPGSKIEKLTPLQQEIAREGGLEQALSRFTPIYIKSNAGGLSTIRFRGTAPSHTAIQFGGININSLTLGHANLSNLATFLFDRIELQYGSSLALNGSGAIGGAIYLEQNNLWEKGFSGSFRYTAGSFGEQMTGLKVVAGNGKLESITKGFLFRKENNFPFKNPYHPNRISHPEPIDDVQQRAAIDNKGVLQELNYRFSPNCLIKSMAWFEDSWQQIQPNMQSNSDSVSSEEIADRNFRFWTQFTNNEHLLKYQLGAGYVHDNQLYNKIEDQIIVTDRLILDASLKQNLFQISEYKLGIHYQYIVPNVYAYSKENIENEQHINLAFSYYIEPAEGLKATLNLRQQWVTGFRVPFTPSLLAEYIPLHTPKNYLAVSASASRSYRVPTLNDRFWGDQGNPDLLPEDGWTFEGGIHYRFRNHPFTSNLRINLFYMDIDNWIEWRNFGVWKAQNIQRVVSQGIEFHGDLHFENGDLASDFMLNYTGNLAEPVENKVSGQGAIQQLIYTPVHTGNVSWNVSYRKYTVFVDGSYTGIRYTDYLGATLPGYFLINAGLLLPLKVLDQETRISLQIINILNKQYQNEKYYAMPGRSFKLSLTINLNFKKP
ncbi:MAG TPA: TonB-dependent receptor [Prolixibacteraceae bacterium]|nr:TonB-dependent receptor [Prolixibacteraceae bacterium]